MSNIQIELADCMTRMLEMKDKEFDLAIVDPPYGINITKQSLGEGGGLYRQPKTYKRGEWDNLKPKENYFRELFRISKNQIIWGGNYFQLFPTSCFIFWDKNNGGSDFADGELAWTSFTSPVRQFTYTWSGFIQGDMKNKERRIHPTQKPVRLYEWLLKNYAKPGDRILDTHLGSGSSAIAADIMGYDFTGFEIDKDYYEAALDRFNRHKQQQILEFN